MGQMQFPSASRRFLLSKSGSGLLLYLIFCAVVSVAVGCGLYSSNLNRFREHKGEEQVVALRLVDAFVTTYSGVSSQLGSDAPVPATFRAHSIEAFSKQQGSGDNFQLRWVGRERRQIRTAPADAEMARAIEAFTTIHDPRPESQLIGAGEQAILRTIYPSLAREQTCVDCHNKLQPNIQWHLNDVMGGFVIDVPVASFLRSLLAEAAGLSVALFVALGIVGLGISIGHARQITERETAAAELTRTQTFLHKIIENIPAVVTVKDAHEQRYVLVNRVAEQLFGIPREGMLGKRIHEVFPSEQADAFFNSDQDVLRSRTLLDVGEQVVNPPHGDARTLMTKKLPILGSDGEPHFLLTLSEDVTERKRAEARIAHMAHHDVLTGLPNRAAFSELLTSTLDHKAATGENCALLCLDLDRFKEVNDVFGHSVGDALLQEVSRRMQSSGGGAFLARLGGDEFTFISTDGPQPSTAAALADRLLADVAGEIEIDGHHLRIGISIGVAIFPTDGAKTTTLLANADAALYRAKAEGRGVIRFFEAQMDMWLRERRVLQQELRSAFERNELFLNYQPQARIGGEIIGFEALLRWRSASRGVIPPSTFIPLAEESGLIIPMGEWILREACREAASWPKPLQIAVNLSPVQFRHGDLPAMVHSVLLESGLNPSRLELEITEGVLLDDVSRTLSILRRLKSLGVRIAMDDFGTGYSSLSYLQSFPFDKIKIDRSFIANLNQNPQSASIVRAVIGLGRGLALPVVAEGVETEDQLAFLSREACNEMQGYLVGRPSPIDDYWELVGRPNTSRLAATALKR
jgi:diguanylate cyclase (GGDEF)-like protein/PAS domain S-box-containing protein